MQPLVCHELAVGVNIIDRIVIAFLIFGDLFVRHLERYVGRAQIRIPVEESVERYFIPLSVVLQQLVYQLC